MRDAQATRERLLEAALGEFTAYGFAGARVDRIADAAGVSKPQLYSYFGDKDALFERVFDLYVERKLATVAVNPLDMGEYAVRLYDAYLADPVLIRLATWARLERIPSGDLWARIGGIDRRIIDSIAQAQREGPLIDEVDPFDLLCLVVAMAGTWAQSSTNVAASPEEPAAIHDRRRAALALSVRRAFER